ncbi:MAG: class I SAM-dependent methyltransferase [Planctomycetota bacterium]
MQLKRLARNFIKHHWKRTFELGQRLGVDVLPRHFYANTPDFRELRRSDDWRRPYDMVGVAGADLDGQVERLRSWGDHDPGDVWQDACDDNGEPGYVQTDADALWNFLAHHRPSQVTQIGCGVSTALMLRCAERFGFDCAITCIEPYPTDFLKTAAADGRITLIAEKAEAVDAERIADVPSGGLLFIDSTHASRPNSDVHHLQLRVIPRLRPGVHIHVHDMQFPYDFGPNILGPGDLFFGAEAVLLHALLVDNAKLAIDVSMSALHHGRPDVLRELLPHYDLPPTDRGLNPPEAFGLSPSACYLVTKEPS